MESVVDFGHAKQIFPDADVFPGIIVARKPTPDGLAPATRVCTIPREQLRIDDLSNQIENQGFSIESEELDGGAWTLEPKSVNDLLENISASGTPLLEFTKASRFRGVTTGLNKAFLIDTPTKEALVAEHPASQDILKPYLRGQDVDRWHARFAGEWMIFARRGIDIDLYPSVKAHLQKFREGLEPKPADWSGGRWPGRKGGSYKWYELQDSIDFYEEFDKPKIYYQEIQFHPSFAFDDSGLYGNNKTSFIVSNDLYLLGVLNSPLMWWHNWRYLPHMKDEALAPTGYLIEKLPIACPADEVRATIEESVSRLVQITRAVQSTASTIVDWLKVEYGLTKVGKKLESPGLLSEDEFIAEVKKRRGRKNPLSIAGLKALRDEYAKTVSPVILLRAEAAQLENTVSDAVNSAYGLTPEQVELMWKTAPPRMPGSDPC